MPKTVDKKKELSLIPATKTKADAQLVMKWRNDPTTLSMFYHSEPKRWRLFWVEFKKNYFKDRGLRPRFVVYHGKKVGFIRFSRYRESRRIKNAVDLDVNISPRWRGKGLGTKAICEAARWAFHKKYSCVIAEVKVRNRASIRAFQAAGFSRLDCLVKQVKDIDKTFNIVRLISHANKN
jgi:RimJ/RimL family protein N-acetyltransferase